MAIRKGGNGVFVSKCEWAKQDEHGDLGGIASKIGETGRRRMQRKADMTQDIHIFRLPWQ